MNFFSIAVNNIKKRFSSYAMYFFSTVSSVSIFTMFCCIYFNPQFAVYKSGTSKIGLILKVSALIVLIFSFIFIIYSNKFFLKERKKEIAIYSLLGMRKSEIGKMLFYENIIMGMISTVAGVILGTIFSRFFTMILFKLMAVGTKVSFAVEFKAVIVPMIVFFVIFVISSVNAYSIIYRYKLIDLLSADKQGEVMPKYSAFQGIISVIFIIAGYIMSFKLDASLGPMQLVLPASIMIVLITAGTILLFKNFLPMVLVNIKKDRNHYYKTSNFLSLSQLIYRIKANSTMFSVIAVLCAGSLIMTSGTYSLYHGLEDTVKYYAPFSYMAKNITSGQRKSIIDTTNKMSKVKITSETDFEMIKGKMTSDKYHSKGSALSKKDDNLFVLSESSYLDIIRKTHIQYGTMSNIKTDFKGGLKDNQCYFIDCNGSDQYCKDMKGSSVSVMINGNQSSYEVTGISLHKYIGISDLHDKCTVVVSDSAYDNLFHKAGESINKYSGFMFDDDMKSEGTVDEINKVIPKNVSIPGVKNVSYIEFYRAIFASYGAYTFIGLFLGVLFMFAMGSLMYYKQIIEAQEEAGRYGILKRIGFNNKDITKSVRKQLGIVFACPFIVGMSHTVFALLLYNRAMDVIGKETPTLLNALLVVVLVLVIYGLFYAASVKKYVQIVCRKNS